MHRIVPTSDSARGESRRPIISFFPVGEPGFKTDEPLYASTSISSFARIVLPTSMDSSTGRPIQMSLVDLGTKRTRPRCDRLLDIDYLFM